MYGQTLSEIELPPGWAWDTPTDAVSINGIQTHVAVFTPADTDNYETVTKILTVEVSRLVPEYTVPTGLTATYGQTLSEIDLLPGWAWDTPADAVGDVGTRTHTATFTPTDRDIYSTVSAELTVAVSKGIPSYTIPTDLTAVYGERLSAVALPAGWNWYYRNNPVGDVGLQIHYATFVKDAGNYYAVTEELTVTVIRAVPNFTVPAGLTAMDGQTLGDIVLPAGWSWETPTDAVGDVGTQKHTAIFTPTDTVNYETVTEDITVTVLKSASEPDTESDESAGDTQPTTDTPPKKSVKTEDVALAVTSVFCLSLIVFCIRKFLIKN
jgi:hypothetical protein